MKKLLGGTFATSEIAPGPGFQSASVLHHVERESFPESRFEGSSPTHQAMVGRAGEMDRLHALWSNACASQGSFVLVEGEAGIGKSRLVHELKREVASQDATHMTCQAWPHFGNSALMPLITLLSRSMGIQRERPPETRLERLEQGLGELGLALSEHVPLFASLLGIPSQQRYPPIPVTASPAQVKAKTFQSMAALLWRMTERRPVLLVVEDLHWIDPSTLEFLSVIFERVATARMLVLLTHRPTFQPPWREAPHLHHIALERLSPEEATTLVEALSQSSLPKKVMRVLVAGTDGTPLFIEVLTRTVMEAGTASQGSVDGPIAVPASLNELLLARLEVLGRHEREILQIAAVLGRSFDRALIRRAAQLANQTVADALDQLVDLGFLVSWETAHEHGEPTRSYSFKHALIQAAAYHSLVKARRQQYHAIAARLFQELEEEAELQPEFLAHHFAEAGDTERALDYWEKAGHLAAKRSASHEAEHHFSNALRLLRADPRRPQMAKREFGLLIAMGAAMMATHGYASAEVRDTYARARELCTDAGGSKELVTALLGIWQSHMSTGRILTSLEVATEMVGLAEGLEGSETLVPAYRALGTSYFLKGDLRTALQYIEHSIQLHDRVAHRGQALLYGQDHGLIARLYAGWTFQLLGLPDRALASAEEALALARELGHAHSLVFAECYTMMVLQQRGDYARIREMASRTLALCEEHHFALWAGWATVERGYAHARLGGGEEAIADIRAGIEAWRKTGAISGQTYLLPLLADTLRRAGRIPEAAEAIGETRALIERTDERMNDANVALLQAEIAMAHDPPDRKAAEKWLAHGLAVARAQGAMSPESAALLGAVPLGARARRRRRGAAGAGGGVLPVPGGLRHRGPPGRQEAPRRERVMAPPFESQGALPGQSGLVSLQEGEDPLARLLTAGAGGEGHLLHQVAGLRVLHPGAHAALHHRLGEPPARQEPRAGRVHRLGHALGRHHLVDQPNAQGLRRREAAPLEEQRHRRPPAEQADQALRAAAARDQAQQHLRQADPVARVACHDAEVAGQRQLDTAARRVPRHGRDGGLGQRLDRVHGAVDLARD